jgi:hypothetical protein
LALTSVWFPTYTHNQLNSLLTRYTADTKAGVITGTVYSDWSNPGLRSQGTRGGG